MITNSSPGEGVRPFDPSLIALPKAVSDASDAFAEALARRTTVQGAVAVARQELEAARAADQVAAHAAVAGGDTPPKAAATAAADALDRAMRAIPAAEQLAREAQAAYLATVADRFEELTATLDDRRRAVHEQAQSALDVLAGALRESLALDELAVEMNLGAIKARRPLFEPVRRSRRKDPTDPLLDPVRKALGAHTGNHFVTGRAAA
jgi:hypothetical protein